MARDLIIVLGETLDKNHNLSSICQERVDKGIELFRQFSLGDLNETPVLLLSAGDDRWHDFVNVATVMTEYALSQGVLEDQILLEPWSRDTVAQIIIIKYLMQKINLQNISVSIVTHDWHMDRVKYLFETLWPGLNGCNALRFVEVSTPEGVEITRTKEEDQKSIESFHNTFSKEVLIKEHNELELLNTLFERHGLYSRDLQIKESILAHMQYRL